MENIPQFPERVPLEICHRELICGLLRRKGVNSSDFAFYNLMGWYLDTPPTISRIDDHYLIFVEGPAKSCIVLPLFGKSRISQAISILLRHFAEMGCSRELSYVPKKILSEILEEFPDLKPEPQREHFDYLYSRKELAELNGRKFHQKKNFVNRIHQDLSPEVEMLDGFNLIEVQRFLDSWYAEVPTDDLNLYLEGLAAKRMFPILQDIGGIGVIVRIEGKIEGISVASPIHESCWVVSVEKANKHRKGLYQYINWVLANKIPETAELINRETDLGLEGLRAAKMSYHPVAFEEKFTVKFPDP